MSSKEGYSIIGEHYIETKLKANEQTKLLQNRHHLPYRLQSSK